VGISFGKGELHDPRGEMVKLNLLRIHAGRTNCREFGLRRRQLRRTLEYIMPRLKELNLRADPESDFQNMEQPGLNRPGKLPI
jgi:hypothetical protein